MAETKAFWDGYLHWAQAIEAARDPDDPFSRAALLEKVDAFYEPIFIRFNVTPPLSELEKLQKRLHNLTTDEAGDENDNVNRSLEAILADFPDFQSLLADPNIILDGNDLKIGVDHSTILAEHHVPLEFFVYRKVQSNYETNDAFKIMDVGAPAVVVTSTPRQVFDRSQKFIGLTKIGAVIDNDIGFLNRRFREVDDEANETSRFSAVWLQSRQQVSGQSSTPAFDVQLGKILTTDAINGMINSGRSERQIYQDLNNELQFIEAFKLAPGRGTHGTAVADLAFGMDPEDPNALADIPLLAVQLPPEASIDTTGTYSEAYIVLGFRWLCAAAREIDPNLNATLVVNISYGVSAGAKDGSTFLEAQIAREIELAKEHGQKVEVVYAYGNSRNERLLAEVKAPSKGHSQPITWVVHPDNRMPVFMEVRRLGEENGKLKLLDLPPEIGVKLTPPGKSVAAAKTARPASGKADPPLNARLSATPWRVYSIPAHDQGSAGGQILDRKNTLAYATIALAPTRRISRSIEPGIAGDWTVEITNSGEEDIDIVLQIQRGDSVPGFGVGGRQSYFDGPFTWKNAQRDVQSPLSNKGTNSRYTTATTSEAGVHLAGALRRTPSGDIRAPYSAETADWTADHGPKGFVVDHILTKGVRASGTYSGTLTRLSGTSAAAALYTNKLLKSA